MIKWMVISLKFSSTLKNHFDIFTSFFATFFKQEFGSPFQEVKPILNLNLAERQLHKFRICTERVDTF